MCPSRGACAINPDKPHHPWLTRPTHPPPSANPRKERQRTHAKHKNFGVWGGKKWAHTFCTSIIISYTKVLVKPKPKGFRSKLTRESLTKSRTTHPHHPPRISKRDVFNKNVHTYTRVGVLARLPPCSVSLCSNHLSTLACGAAGVVSRSRGCRLLQGVMSAFLLFFFLRPF